MDKDQIPKIICYGLACIVVYYVLISILPYVAIGFALYAFGSLVMENGRNNRRNRH